MRCGDVLMSCDVWCSGVKPLLILVRYTDGLVWLQVGGQAAADDFENRSIPQNELGALRRQRSAFCALL